ncbi:MAG: hypothetical protein QM775_29445 [Pirellulales bacterium]
MPHYRSISGRFGDKSRRVIACLLVALAAAGGGWSTADAADPDATRVAALRIIERGGYVVGLVSGKRLSIRTAAEVPPGPWQIWEVFLRRITIGDDDLAVVAAAPGVRGIFISDTALTTAGAGHLARMTELREIALTATGTTDAGVKQLGGLKLTALAISKAEITDEALQTVSAMPTLLTLRLENDAKLTDAGIALLTKLPKLEHIALANSQLTDRGVAELAKSSLVEAPGCKLHGRDRRGGCRHRPHEATDSL